MGSAILAALCSALLFGLSTPLAKLFLGSVDPLLLAGLFYLGSGLGLAGVRLFRAGRGRSRDPSLAGADIPWLSVAIAAGGVVGPVLLFVGLSVTDAATASLLLTVEGAATALIAWFVFHENFDRRVAAGMFLILAGALVLSWQGGAMGSGVLGEVAIVGACVAWAIDNNLTRRIALADPIQIAMWKGLCAGPVNIALAMMGGAGIPKGGIVASALLVGFVGYGVSLVLFVVALRGLGTARTGAYFATAPFVGAVAAISLSGEPFSASLAAAGLLMAAGVWLHLSERHAHLHVHEADVHSHRHIHDVHHQHSHRPDDPPGEPHVHAHAHGRLRHAHRHFPDSHHRHTH